MYEIMYHDGSADETADTIDGAIARIATKFARHPSEVGLDDRSSSCRTQECWHAWLAGCGPDRDPVATISYEDIIEPPPGWEARAIDRAKRERVI